MEKRTHEYYDGYYNGAKRELKRVVYVLIWFVKFFASLIVILLYYAASQDLVLYSDGWLHWVGALVAASAVFIVSWWLIETLANKFENWVITKGKDRIKDHIIKRQEEDAQRQKIED